MRYWYYLAFRLSLQGTGVMTSSDIQCSDLAAEDPSDLTIKATVCRSPRYEGGIGLSW